MIDKSKVAMFSDRISLDFTGIKITNDNSFVETVSVFFRLIAVI